MNKSYICIKLKIGTRVNCNNKELFKQSIIMAKDYYYALIKRIIYAV
jgi:hypothetical protein